MNQSMFLVLLAGILADNYAIQNFLGVESLLGNGSGAKKALKLGGLTAAVMIPSAAIAWPLQNYVLNIAPYLQTLVFVALILLVAAVVSKAAKRPFDEGFVLLTVNGAALGLCLTTAQMGFGEAMMTAIGAGAGFALAMAVFASLRERVEDDKVPAAFRGLPVSLLIAAMMSLALFAF